MKDFVIYHNPDAMGRSARELTQLSIVTDKPVSNIQGDRIWLLTGEGQPRTFFLVAWFIAEEIRSGAESGFGTCVSGKDGTIFRPMKELNSLDWFSDFKRSQGNFAFGLQ